MYINEFLASNTFSYRNPQTQEFSDWIELYNAGTATVSIFGFYLSDDPAIPQKWKILVDRPLYSGEYIVFWADGYDNFLHTNFKLKKSGGYIGLYDLDGSVIDSLSYGLQEDDISYGRILSDLNSWAYYQNTSPGSPNPGNYSFVKTPDPVFSLPGGYYSGSQSISILSHDPQVEVHYTVDGTPPAVSDPVYTAPLSVDSTTALRVRAFANGMLPGNILTQTYFVNEPVNLPFISLVTAPDNLFSDSTGIYVIGTNGIPGYCADIPMNLNQDWERQVNIELYDKEGKMELNQEAGVQIFGGCSRTRYPQKSLALFARKDYGKASFDCQLFKDKPIYTFQSFILRCSGDDEVHTMFKDAMAQTLLSTMDVDKQAYRPAVVFINGQYWGIHNIREKITEHYIAENYNINAKEVNLLEGNPSYPDNVKSGTADDYNDLILYVSTHDLKDDSSYKHVTSKIDINNYIDYFIAEIFLTGNDWPGNNIRFWNTNTGPHNRWRWIIYDLDNTFFYFYVQRNILELATDPACNCNWPNPPWSTLLFRNLLSNETFRNEFIQRFAWHINTTFQPSRIIHIIDSLKDNIKPEIPRHIQRWGGQLVPFPESWISPTFNSMEEWEGNINNMKQFAQERKTYALQHVMDYFRLQRNMVHFNIRSDQLEAGVIKLNDQTIQGAVHTGEYFMDIPLTIKAIASLGYKFSYWDYTTATKGKQHIKNQVLNIIPSEDLTLVAYFEKITGNNPSLVINEINYHSPDDPDPADWVELYNVKNEIVDLSGWTFKDEDETHVFHFPAGLEIKPDGYLVLCENITAFRNSFPEVNNCTGDLGFGLSNGGEMIRLYAPGQIMVDYVQYDDKDPWPASPDGTGPTLELIDPGLNNNLPESWKASFEHGTPGTQNFSNMIQRNVLMQNFPNPFNSSTVISFSMNQPANVLIKVYDMFGREITTLMNEPKEISTYRITWDAGTLPGGMYHCVMYVNNKLLDSRKMVIQH